MKLKEQLRAVWEGIKQLPYKWQWALLMFSSMLLFSWWDELIVWGVAVGWKWLVAPIYYGFEYGVLVPLTIWLGVKTYRKMGLEVNIGQLAKQSIMNSLPMLIWRRLKKTTLRRRSNMQDRREVKPARLPRFPRPAVCPSCGKGGEDDGTVCSYVDSGMPEDSPRYIGCGYCGYDGPAPDHPLYPREGKHN